ncbi:MAG: glycosyltransferase family 92 protein [Planctomycetota bacterium]|jgi:hypothetical protein
MRNGRLQKLRHKLLDPYLHERMARRLRRDGHLSDDQDLTCREGRLFLAAVAMIRGEEPFLEEWLEFHAMMGVEHFILYDNGLEPETERILAPYAESGLVTRIPCPDLAELRGCHSHIHDLSLQRLVYGDCVFKYRKRMDWLLKFDLDEFIYPVSERHGSVAEVLKGLDLNAVLGIRVRMLQFGSSGHVERPEGLVIENYTKCEEGVSFGTKSIGNTRMLARTLLVDPHAFHYRGWKIVQGKLTGTPKVLPRAETDRLLRINHYRLKSREDFLRKGEINREGYMGDKETAERFEQIDATHNQAENRDILRFLAPLKERLAERARSG